MSVTCIPPLTPLQQLRAKLMPSMLKTTETSMYFMFARKNYPVSHVQHILMILVSFEMQMNNQQKRYFRLF